MMKKGYRQLLCAGAISFSLCIGGLGLYKPPVQVMATEGIESQEQTTETGAEATENQAVEHTTEGSLERGYTDPLVQINETNFPDEGFRRLLNSNPTYSMYVYDLNQDGWLSQEEIDQVEELHFSVLQNAKGLEYFTNLKILTSEYHAAGALDLSKHTKLKTVSISTRDYNWILDGMNLSGCTQLETLNIRCAILTNIALPKTTSLKNMDLQITSFTDISTLDLTPYTSLENLHIISSYISEIRLGNNSNLKNIELVTSDLESIDLSGCTSLQSFSLWSAVSIFNNDASDVWERQINCFVDVSKNANLESLNLVGVKNTQLDLSQNAKLTNLRIHSCRVDEILFNQNIESVSLIKTNINELDLANKTSLRNLTLINNKRLEIINIQGAIGISSFSSLLSPLLKTVDVSNCSQLSSIAISDALLNNINLSGINNLESLRLNNNCFTSLDLGDITSIRTLECQGNQLTSLILPSSSVLTYLNCSDNRLKTLSVNSTKNMEALYCSNNELRTLNLGTTSEITELKCYDNFLKALDLSNQNIIRYIYCQNNELTSINMPQTKQEVKVLMVQQNYLTSSQIESYGQWVYAGDDYNSPGLYYSMPQKNATYDVKGYIARLYTCCLGRTGSEAEIYSWHKKILRGEAWINGTSLAYNFAFSPEYIAKNTTDDAYIQMIYQMMLNRAPSATELSTMKRYLTDGMSRRFVFCKVSGSREFEFLCEKYDIEWGTCGVAEERDKNPNVTRYVNRIYLNTLGRSGDANGLNYWCQAILNKKFTPTSAAESFILSPEFTAKNLNNTEYVKVLYRTFMGREADQGGLNYWVGRLQKGESRKTVLRSFAGCDEFKKIIASFGL